jgi:iron complex outermembrane receptor protein/outer membrane receptor for ferrienterochelin and colicins
MNLRHRNDTGRTIRTRTLLLILFLFGCSLLPPRALAEEDADIREREDKAFELGEIVVTGKAPAAEKVTTITERNQEDFQAWSDYSVADALRGIPGGEVTLAPGGLPGNGKQESLIRLRGFETTDVLIMVDGMPLTEPYMKRVDLSQIILDNVAKVKVIKGPSSVLYGANTAGGVINIVTQEGDEFRTRLDQRFGDYKSFRTIGHHRGVVGPVRYTLGGSVDVSDGFPISRDFEGTPNQPGTLRENSDYERYNLAGRLGTDLGKRGTIAVAGGYYNFDGGVPYDMLDPFPSTLWRKEWDRWYLNGAGDYAFTDTLGLKAQLFYDRFDNKITTYTDTSFEEIASGGRAISTHENSLLGYFLNPYWDLGRWSYLRAGIRYGKDDISIQSNLGDPWKDYASETFSFSLEDEVRPHEKVSLVAGIGYNLYRKIKAYQQSPGDDVDTVDFQAGVLYSPWPFLDAHASIGRKTTFPTMRQLYGEPNGDPNLSEQTAMLYELGVDVNYKTHYPYGSFALFRSDVDNLIGKKELPPDPLDPTSPEWKYENVDEAVLQGLELALSWVPIDPLLLRCTYTYLDTEDKRSDRLLKELDFRPNHIFAIEARYQSSFGLSANTRYIYTSSQEYEEEGIAPVRRVMTLPARGVWDIHLGQKFPFRRYPDWFVEVFLDVNNVLDEYYEEDPFKAAPGRMVWGGIRAEF